MWNFKPDEKNGFFNSARKAIINNRRFTAKNDLVTPEHVPRLLKETEAEFPGITKLYDKIPAWVTKADLVRLLKVYCDGGTYCDADCLIKKPFDSYAHEYSVVLFTEFIINDINVLGPRECKNPENKTRIANFFFYSKLAKHPFFRDVIMECMNRLNELLVKNNARNLSSTDILWLCGPDVITSVYHKKKHSYRDIVLCDTSFLQHERHGSWR